MSEWVGEDFRDEMDARDNRRELIELRGQLTAVTTERDDLQANFDLRWKADMRAIKMWQEAHPGNDLVWPDHADLCVWLLEERERLLKLMEKVLAHLPQDTVSVTLWDEDDGTIIYHPWYLEATAVIDAARGQKEAEA